MDSGFVGDSRSDAPADARAPRAGARRPRLPQADAWQAVIGERSRSRYLRRFEQLSLPGALPIGWHWPAFLATGGWFLYRKMWGWAAAYLLALPLLFIGERQVAMAAGAVGAAEHGLAMLSLALLLVAPALFADRLYLAHCNRLIGRMRRDMPRHKYVARLASHGGTSAGAAAVAAVMAGFAVVGLLVGLVVAVASDYDKRVKVVEALRVGAAARAAVGAFVGRQGTLPATLREAGFSGPALPPHVTGIEIDPRNGTIQIDTRLSRLEAGSIYLVPQEDDRRQIVWSCRADPLIEAFTPGSCQTPE